jgi:hypothetical protein
VIAKETYWFRYWGGDDLRKAEPGGHELVRAIRDLAKFLYPHKRFLRSLGRSGGDLCVSVGIFMDDFNADWILPVTLLSQLAELGVSVRLDSYDRDDKIKKQKSQRKARIKIRGRRHNPG